MLAIGIQLSTIWGLNPPASTRASFRYPLDPEELSMKTTRTLLPWCALLALLLTTASGSLSAQEAAAPTKARAKPRGRLPAYYAQVVSNLQRERIYKVQQSYSEQIEALEAQLKDLQTKMQTEIRGVLTPEQQKKIDELTAAAKGSRGRATADAAADASATPTATPTAGPATAAKKGTR
jgi:TolA-binding protein